MEYNTPRYEYKKGGKAKARSLSNKVKKPKSASKDVSRIKDKIDFTGVESLTFDEASTWIKANPELRLGMGMSPMYKMQESGSTGNPQSRLDSYIRAGLNPQQEGTNYDDSKGPTGYGLKHTGMGLSSNYGIEMNRPSIYGGLGYNSDKFNANIEHKRGLGTKSTNANLGYSNKGFNTNVNYSNEFGKRFGASAGYNSPNFNINTSYLHNNKQPEVGFNAGFNKNGFNANAGYQYGSGQHSLRGNVGFEKGDYNFNVSGEKSPDNIEFKVGLNKKLGSRPVQQTTPITLPEFTNEEEAAYPIPRAQTSDQIENMYNKHFKDKRSFIQPINPMKKGDVENEAEDFLVKMVDSPLFPERYNTMRQYQASPEEVDSYRNHMKNNMKKVQYWPTGVTYENKLWNSEDNYGGNYNRVYSLPKDKYGVDILPDDPQWDDEDKRYRKQHMIFREHDSPMVTMHELSHASTLSDGIPNKTYHPYSKDPSKQEDVKYYSSPDYKRSTEHKAYLDEVRKHLYDKKIYDATTKRFDENDYDKLIKEYENINKELEKDPDNRELNYIKGAYDKNILPMDKEGTIKMFNSFVSNQQNNKLPIAQTSRMVSVQKPSGNIKEYDINSSRYRRMYPDLVPVDEGGLPVYNTSSVDVVAEAPDWLKRERAAKRPSMYEQRVKNAGLPENRDIYRNLGKNIAQPVFNTGNAVAEMTGIPGTVRFAQNPYENLKGTLGAVGDFLTSPVTEQGYRHVGDEKNLEGLYNTIDAAGVIGGLTNLARKPIQAIASQAGEYLTTKTPLRNAYKINPYSTKLNKYNRVVGSDALDDLYEEGVVRTARPKNFSTEPGINLDRRGSTPFASFSNGGPEQTYINSVYSNNELPYILSTNRDMKPSTLGRHGKGSTLFPVDETGKFMKEFPANEVDIFDPKPHWLKGYNKVLNPYGKDVDEAARLYYNKSQIYNPKERKASNLIQKNQDKELVALEKKGLDYKSQEWKDVIRKTDLKRKELNNIIKQREKKESGFDKYFGNELGNGSYGIVYDFKDKPNFLYKMGHLNPMENEETMQHLIKTGRELKDENISLPKSLSLLKEQPYNSGIYGQVLKKVPGSRSSFNNHFIPTEAYDEMGEKLSMLRDKNIEADYVGGNFFYDPDSKKISVFDLNTNPRMGKQFLSQDRWIDDVNKLDSSPRFNLSKQLYGGRIKAQTGTSIQPNLEDVDRIAFEQRKAEFLSANKPFGADNKYLENTGIPTGYENDYRQYKKMYPMTEDNKDTYDAGFFEFNKEVDNTRFAEGLDKNSPIARDILSKHNTARSITSTDTNQQRNRKLQNIYNNHPQFRRSITATNPNIRRTDSSIFQTSGQAINIDGKEYNTNSPEYRSLYNQGQIASVDSEGIPNVYQGSDEAWNDYHEGQRKNRIANAVRGGTGSFARGLAQGAGAAFLGAGEIASTPIAMGTEFLSGRGDYRSALPNPQRVLSGVGVGSYDGNHQQTPGSLVSDNPFISTAIDLPIDVMTGRAVSKYGPKVIKSIKPIPLDSPSYVYTSNNLPKVNTQKYRYSRYNKKTGNYDIYEEDFAVDPISNRNPIEDPHMKVKMRNLMKQQGISPIMDYLYSKKIIKPSYQDLSDKLMNPLTGEIYDGNTRYWLNERHGVGNKDQVKGYIDQRLGHITEDNDFKPKYSSETNIKDEWLPNESSKDKYQTSGQLVAFPSIEHARSPYPYGNTEFSMERFRQMIDRENDESNYRLQFAATQPQQYTIQEEADFLPDLDNIDDMGKAFDKRYLYYNKQSAINPHLNNDYKRKQKSLERDFDNYMSKRQEGGDINYRMRDYKQNMYNRQARQFVTPYIEQNTDKDFVRRIIEPNSVKPILYPDGEYGTHKMVSTDYSAMPLIRNEEDGLVDYSGDRDSMMQGVNKNYNEGEYVDLPNPQLADKFAREYKSFWGHDVQPTHFKYKEGGRVPLTIDNEKHLIYRKESPTGNGEGVQGHIMVNHPSKDKGKWDTIDLTDVSNYKVKTIQQGVDATKKWHEENPMQLGGMIRYEDNLYAKGGYIVRKSNERKGKTHVVTGPGGTKKYFGDPNMGERSNSKHGKDAFYARHATNLKKNPYFRAYARSTWKEGGEITQYKDDDQKDPTINCSNCGWSWKASNAGSDALTCHKCGSTNNKIEMKNGGQMIKRADGSYSKRGLWDNIRANVGSGRKPTKQMLDQERKINYAKYGGELPCLTCGGHIHRNKMQTGGPTKSVSEVYTEKTGEPWQMAKQKGLTDGSYENNIALLNKLNNNELGNVNAKGMFGDAVDMINSQPQPQQQPQPQPQYQQTTNVKPTDNIYTRVQSYMNANTSKDQYEDWNDIRNNQSNLNNLSNEDKILHYKSTRKNEPFVIVDKKNGEIKIYKDVKSKPLIRKVDLGEAQSDAQTVTKYKDINKDGKITDADKVNGKFTVDWDAGNKSTGAGKYYISNYNGLPLLNMMNERQYNEYLKTGKIENVATSFHMGYQKDDKNKVSNGCVRGDDCTLDDLSKITKNNTEVFILPEEEGNRFVFEDGELKFKANQGKYQTYVDKKGNIQKGQGVNASSNKGRYAPITTSTSSTFNDRVGKDVDQKQKSNRVDPFVNALSENKEEVMNATGITSDTYNELAKMSFGIYGAETRYGKQYPWWGDLGRAVNKWWDPKNSSSPDYYNKYHTYGATDENNSVGLTQLRWSQLNDREKKVLGKLGIHNNADFLEPKKAAKGTTAILAVRYQEQLNDKQKEQMWDYLPNRWNNRPNYPERVKENSDNLRIYQKR